MCGSEVVVAQERGVSSIAFDIDASYVDVANSRLGLGGEFKQGTRGVAEVRVLDQALVSGNSATAGGGGAGASAVVAVGAVEID